MLLLDGKSVAARLADELKDKVAALSRPLVLSIVQVGDKKESNAYIERKKKFGAQIGVEVRHIKLSEDVGQEELQREIDVLNTIEEVTGIIVQLPLPEHLDAQAITSSVAPEKDVDGLVPGSSFTPATPKGVMTLLGEYDIDVRGLKVVVMGHSRLVGAPLAELLRRSGAQVDVVDITTKNPKEVTRTADILCVAIGKPKFVTREHLRPGAVVVDIGITVVEGKLVGDVDFDEVGPQVSAISPVPGGVGPMTILSLFQNVYIAGSRLEG